MCGIPFSSALCTPEHFYVVAYMDIHLLRSHRLISNLLFWQMSKVDQMGRMEAELTSLDSQLERAKLAHAARSSRLEAGSARAAEATPSSKTPEVKRTLFRDESGMDGHRNPALDPDLDATSASSLKTGEWTPQLDLSHDDTKVNSVIPSLVYSLRCSATLLAAVNSPLSTLTNKLRSVLVHVSSCFILQATEKRTINCEACSIKCASAAMYADHLRGRRHRYAECVGASVQDARVNVSPLVTDALAIRISHRNSRVRWVRVFVPFTEQLHSGWSNSSTKRPRTRNLNPRLLVRGQAFPLRKIIVRLQLQPPIPQRAALLSQGMQRCQTAAGGGGHLTPKPIHLMPIKLAVHPTNCLVARTFARCDMPWKDSNGLRPCSWDPRGRCDFAL